MDVLSVIIPIGIAVLLIGSYLSNARNALAARWPAAAALARAVPPAATAFSNRAAWAAAGQPPASFWGWDQMDPGHLVLSPLGGVSLALLALRSVSAVILAGGACGDVAARSP
jgi:hypothetical protein